MDLWQSLVLGLVQGATEFVPVSSSGHLILVPWLFNWPAGGLAFDAFLHLGTLLAVLAYFRHDLLALLVAGWKSLWERKLGQDPYRKISWLILVGTIPALILGLALENFFEQVFATPQMVPLFLLVTGVILFTAERLLAARTAYSPSHDPEGRLPLGSKSPGGLSLADALIIGLAQAIAILPGVSRSGSTISAGVWRGLPRAEAARFSFLLSVPVVLGAGLLKLVDLWKFPDFADKTPSLVVGFLAATISGYLAISFLLSFLKYRSLYPFAIYCWVVGGATLTLAFFRG